MPKEDCVRAKFYKDLAKKTKGMIWLLSNSENAVVSQNFNVSQHPKFTKIPNTETRPNNKNIEVCSNSLDFPSLNY